MALRDRQPPPRPPVALAPFDPGNLDALIRLIIEGAARLGVARSGLPEAHEAIAAQFPWLTGELTFDGLSFRIIVTSYTANEKQHICEPPLVITVTVAWGQEPIASPQKT